MLGNKMYFSSCVIWIDFHKSSHVSCILWCDTSTRICANCILILLFVLVISKSIVTYVCTHIAQSL